MRGMSERYQDLLLLQIPNWDINSFSYANSEETGVAEEELVSIKMTLS